MRPQIDSSPPNSLRIFNQSFDDVLGYRILVPEHLNHQPRRTNHQPLGAFLALAGLKSSSQNGKQGNQSTVTMASPPENAATRHLSK